MNSFGDKAQDNQDSHFSHGSEEKEKEQGNDFHFCKAVYTEEAMQKVIPNIQMQTSYHLVVHKRASII